MPMVRCTTWAAEHQAALRSAMFGTQRVQARLARAGLAENNWCQLCLAAGIPREGVDATHVNAEPPCGTFAHRHIDCHVNAHEHDAVFTGQASHRNAVAVLARAAMGRPLDGDADTVEGDATCVWQAVNPESNLRRGRSNHQQRGQQRPQRPPLQQPGGSGTASAAVKMEGQATWALVARAARVSDLLHDITEPVWRSAWRSVSGACSNVASWTRALVPTLPVATHGTPAEGTFVWHRRPADPAALASATFYTDASGVDIRWHEIAAYGWAFVAIDGGRSVVASA